MGSLQTSPQMGGGASVRRATPGRLIHKADFEGLMSAPVWSRSAHFALHHVVGAPRPASGRHPGPGEEKLSTDLYMNRSELVDNVHSRIWIGAVVPKRHARRSVTRNLLKRQIREAFGRHEATLDRGLWLVRLRLAFAPKDFPSARSALLAEAARTELDQLLSQPRRREPGRPRRAPGHAPGRTLGHAPVMRSAVRHHPRRAQAPV